MVNISLTYNPYLVKTDIEIDGQRPKDGDPLNIPSGVRLQEWIEKLPSILSSMSDDKVSLKFIGTRVDFEDVKMAFQLYGVPCKMSFREKTDVDTAERLIDEIFSDIQQGPIRDLKTKSIRDTFKKAKSSEFEVNVVATMSSGKSTLINALLGKKLMPAKNEATTATIVKIKDIDGKKDFSAKAYDASHNLLKAIPKVSLKEMQLLNDDENVYEVDLEGDIRFVSSEGMNLVLVDTPGPNNSRDIHHQEMTFRMLEDSDKSLVLFVMNGRQLGINDEKVFLDFICSNMKKGGKRTRDRYVFVVNQLDAFKPNSEDDGEDCISKALSSVMDNLTRHGIHEANIFPVSAGVALEKRIGDEDEELSYPFYKKSKKYEIMRLNNYYEFTHLPTSVKDKINLEIESAGIEGRVEIYSGIRNIEEAIRLYINKYARTTKICDLVFSFNNQLAEMSTMAKLEESLRENGDYKRSLKEDIIKSRKLIEKSDDIKRFSSEIDATDYTTDTVSQVKNIVYAAKKQYKELVSGKGDKVVYAQALVQCQSIERQYGQSFAQAKVCIDRAIKLSFKNAVEKTARQYVKRLSEIGINLNVFNIGSYYVNMTTPNFGRAVKINTRSVDESYTINESYQVEIGGTRTRNAGFGCLGAAGVGALIAGPIGAAIGGLVGIIGGAISGHDSFYETKYRPKRIEKTVEYVDMNEVAASAIHEFNLQMDRLEESVVNYVHLESESLKKEIKARIQSIDKLTLKKYDELESLLNREKQTDEEIEVKKRNLKWLIDIQDRVNRLIDF